MLPRFISVLTGRDLTGNESKRYSVVVNNTFKPGRPIRKKRLVRVRCCLRSEGTNSNRHSSRHLTLLKYDEHSKFCKLSKLSFELSCCCVILNYFLRFSSPHLWNLSTKYDTKKSPYLWNQHIMAWKTMCTNLIHSLIRIRKLSHSFSNITQLVKKNRTLAFSMK